MKRRHYITSLIVLVLPVIVIYALTNYGIEREVLEQGKALETEPKLEYSCQKKQSVVKEGQSNN